MTIKERFSNILGWFRINMQSADTELVFNSPFQLLIAVILSAQCTDKRVNIVTARLFKAFPDSRSMAKATFEEIFSLISSISYPNNKAKHIIQTSQLIEANFNGIVPSSIDELITLPGVGRKTANVIASIVYNEPVIAVDTHVFRVSHRLGLSKGKTPEKVEKDLEANVPVCDRAKAHHWLILHGRYICTARKPKCLECGLSLWCKYYLSQCGNDEQL